MNAWSPLTKSKYMAGLQCLKQLWWRVHEPRADELTPGPTLQAGFDQGHEVTAKAREYVPGGLLVDGATRRERVERTRAAIAGGERVIYEAAIEHDGVLVVADILQRSGSRWSLAEVKSSTRVKRAHLPDVAVQCWVLRQAGLDVERVEVMRLNRECRYPDLSRLFVREDLTTRVTELMPGVGRELGSFSDALEQPQPEVDPGDHCSRPYVCPFVGRCWSEAEPDPFSIDNLYSRTKRQTEYLRALGCSSLRDIPACVSLSDIQHRQRASAIARDMIVVDGLDERLSRLSYPIAHLDFETVQPAIPVWPGCRPYDHIPVQVSVHVEDGLGGVTHADWIADGPGDPRDEIAQQIVRMTHPARTVLVYHQPYEESRIHELQQAVPEMRAELQGVLDRMVDLLPIVREHVYHPEFHGSFSIKRVLPALVPDVGYAGLDVADGLTASAVLKRMLLDDGVGAGERQAMRESLRAYCRMDTYAMVRLLGRLRELV
ncbi:MAG: DUF2779 domain-containing protein [bacterium]|nr:DUF2779 domain-containing protein [bacterium]